jgi:hypothetical protein
MSRFEGASKYYERTPERDVYLRLSLARPLDEADIRRLLKADAELFGKTYDTSMMLNITSDGAYAVISSMLFDLPDVLANVIECGTDLSLHQIEQMPHVALVFKAAQVIAATRAEYAAGQLEATVIEEITPFSAHLRGKHQ